MSQGTKTTKKSGLDTSFLATGLSSPSSRLVAKNRDEARKEAEKEREKLQPYAEIVDSIIEQALAEARDFETLPFDINQSEESLKAVMVARKMNIDFIKSFKAKVATKLGKASKARKSNG